MSTPLTFHEPTIMLSIRKYFNLSILILFFLYQLLLGKKSLIYSKYIKYIYNFLILKNYTNISNKPKFFSIYEEIKKTK